MKRLPAFPAERALKVISGRWKAIIVYHLLDGPKRLSELKRLIPDVSQKVLIQQLRELEAHGLIHREVFRQVPPRVDYTATALGLSLEPVLVALCDWGQHHATELNELDRLAECVPPAIRRSQVLEERIFIPLGMDNTLAYIRERPPVPNRAFGYSLVDGEMRHETPPLGVFAGLRLPTKSKELETTECSAM